MLGAWAVVACAPESDGASGGGSSDAQQESGPAEGGQGTTSSSAPSDTSSSSLSDASTSTTPTTSTAASESTTAADTDTGTAPIGPPLAEVPFDLPPPYHVYWDDGASSSELDVYGDPGPKGQGVVWNFEHHDVGGVGDGPFARYSVWDTNVAGIDAGSFTAGWSQTGSLFRPRGGWVDAPYYLRFRIRIAAPLVPYAGALAGCDGDTQLKFFIWAPFTEPGTNRIIVMLHAGDDAGGTDPNTTTIHARAGVSGSYALASVPNGEWHDVQIAWRWGDEGTAFQRIYIDNDVEASPTSENLMFDDLGDHWTFDPSGLDNQFFWGNIVNTGTCVGADAEIDVMQMQIDDEFDPTWHALGTG